MITSIFNYLDQNRTILQYNGFLPESIKIVYKNKKKRFTEFYRIRVQYAGNRSQYFWIRIVKNKPEDEIYDALDSQFTVIKDVYNYFESNRSEIHLSCCEPIAILLNYNAVITKECNGVLLNQFLRLSIPLFSKKKISEVFYNCGIWLYHFHRCYSEENISEIEFKERMAFFKKKFGREPEARYKYITKCHNDYTPRNIFVSDNSVETIDFVGVKSGFPEEDILFFEQYSLNARFNGLYSKKMKYHILKNFLNGYNHGNQLKLIN